MTENEPISTKIFKAGETLIKEGEKGNYIYLVMSGSINIYKTKNGEQKFIKRMSSGEIFGEMGILTNEPRNATAIAAETSKIIMIRDHALHSALLNDKLPIIEPLTRQLVLRFKEMEQEKEDNLSRIKHLEEEVATLKEQVLNLSLNLENP